MREAELLDRNHLTTVRQLIIAWYNEEGREFPWRITKNPFQILIAEMLLRRTTATAVARVFEAFITRFDSPLKLKHARKSTVETMVATLGLQSIRAKHLQDTAAMLVEDHGGKVPKDMEVLESLPGVGRYAAAAVSNFAFEMPASMVDGNVLHLMNRVFDLAVESPVDEKIWEFMDDFGGKQDSRLYWGIIDLVSLICLRRKPRCGTCPLAQRCIYYLHPK
jgi:A/G-specific adenine glycosylase